MALDPAIGRVMRALALAPASTVKETGQAAIERRRAAFRGLMRFAETGARIARVEDRVVPGPGGAIPIRLYAKGGAAAPMLPGLIFLHGGGLVCGGLDTHDALCRALCEASGCAVIAVDYRLAPEHPFPAAIEDAEAATLHVLDGAAAFGLDPARIAIAGDSAGATLAAVVCQRVARARPGALALQVLLCPILDWARAPVADAPLLDAAVMAEERACYLPAGQDPADPHVSPLRARDMQGQPPAHIHTAEFDPVHVDGRAYAERLRSAGIAARHVCHPGMVHLFYGLGGVVPYARTALRAIGAEIGAALA